MERHELLALMMELHLAGMRAVFDEVLRDAIRRERSLQDFLGDLLKAELAQKKARTISYQIGATHLPVAKELTEFVFAKSPVNETLVRDLHGGSFLETRRNAVLIGGTGSGKTHLAIAITVNCVRKGARARFFTAVDLVNRLEAETRAGNAGKIADHLARVDLVVLDELGYLPSAIRPNRRPIALSPGQPALREHLNHRHHEPLLCRVAVRVRVRQDDHRITGSPDPPLRHHRNRQRKLALQKPQLIFLPKVAQVGPQGYARA